VFICPLLVLYLLVRTLFFRLGRASSYSKLLEIKKGDKFIYHVLFVQMW